MAHFLVNRCHTSLTKPTTQTEKTRPSQGRVSSATATAISNIRMLEPQAQKQTTHRAVYRKRGDRTSIGVHPAIAGETPPWLRHARTMSTWSLSFARITREA